MKGTNQMFASVPWRAGVLGVLIASAVSFAQIAPPTPSVQSSDEDKAWATVNGLSAESLNGFLKEFPKGTHSREAAGYLLWDKKLAEIIAGKVRTQDVITNAQFGESWPSWKKADPHTTAQTGGLFLEQTDKETSVGIFRVVGGGATPNEMYMRYTNTFLSCTEKVYLGKVPGHNFSLQQGPFWPPGDGSIVGIRTSGVKASYFDLTFETSDDPLIFGVVGSIGLVHLGGAGKVTLADGKVIVFK